MCGLLPCKFWLLVVVYPGYALAIAVTAGFLGGLLVVSLVQSRPVALWLDRLHRFVWRLPECSPFGCYCRQICLWLYDVDPQTGRTHG